MDIVLFIKAERSILGVNSFLIFHMVKSDGTHRWTGKHTHDSQLASGSHKQISCTAAVSHSKISLLESSNYRVRIYCHSRVQTPEYTNLLRALFSYVTHSIVDCKWSSREYESRTSATLHLSGTVTSVIKNWKFQKWSRDRRKKPGNKKGSLNETRRDRWGDNVNHISLFWLCVTLRPHLLNGSLVMMLYLLNGSFMMLLEWP